MSGHTPGPWQARLIAGGARPVWSIDQAPGAPVVDEIGCQIVDLASVYDAEDAALIAAAPGLLTWAKWAAKFLDSTEVAGCWQLEQLHRVIEKAEARL